MSSNVLRFDESNSEIKTQRTNCVNQDTADYKLHMRTHSHDDECYIDVHSSQSRGPGNYQTSSHFQCECLAPDAVETSVQNPAVFIKNGVDVDGCVIDESTKLRIGKTRKFPRCPDQLFTRPYLTVPFMGRGSGNMHLDTRLVPGEDTTAKRQCNVLSGVTTPNFCTPLIPHLKDNIQNPEHIIEEVVDDNWIRGGAPSRLVIRDVDYLQRCGYNYMNKSTNKEFWENKHNYL